MTFKLHLSDNLSINIFVRGQKFGRKTRWNFFYAGLNLLKHYDGCTTQISEVIYSKTLKENLLEQNFSKTFHHVLGKLPHEVIYSSKFPCYHFFILERSPRQSTGIRRGKLLNRNLTYFSIYAVRKTPVKAGHSSNNCPIQLKREIK